MAYVFALTFNIHQHATDDIHDAGREQSMKPMIGKSIDQSINRCQSMPINRLISIVDEQSMLEFYVIIDFIDYQFLSIININRSVNLHRLASIGRHFLCVLFSVKISKTRSLYASNNDENWDNTLIFSQRYN